MAYNVLCIPPYSVFTTKPTMVGVGENSFNIKALRWLKNDILKLVFAIEVFDKGAVFQIYEAEFTEGVLNILLFPESTLGPTMVGPEETF